MSVNGLNPKSSTAHFTIGSRRVSVSRQSTDSNQRFPMPAFSGMGQQPMFFGGQAQMPLPVTDGNTRSSAAATQPLSAEGLRDKILAQLGAYLWARS